MHPGDITAPGLLLSGKEEDDTERKEIWTSPEKEVALFQRRLCTAAGNLLNQPLGVLSDSFFKVQSTQGKVDGKLEHSPNRERHMTREKLLRMRKRETVIGKVKDRRASRRREGEEGRRFLSGNGRSRKVDSLTFCRGWTEQEKKKANAKKGADELGKILRKREDWLVLIHRRCSKRERRRRRSAVWRKEREESYVKWREKAGEEGREREEGRGEGSGPDRSSSFRNVRVRSKKKKGDADEGSILRFSIFRRRLQTNYKPSDRLMHESQDNWLFTAEVYIHRKVRCTYSWITRYTGNWGAWTQQSEVRIHRKTRCIDTARRGVYTPESKVCTHQEVRWAYAWTTESTTKSGVHALGYLDKTSLEVLLHLDKWNHLKVRCTYSWVSG